MLDRTIFVFLSDNGQTFGDHRWDYKLVPYERSIKVPFLMSGPGIVPRLIPKVVMNVDLVPTILDLAGATQLPSDGLSLEPLLAATGTLSSSGVLLEHKYYGSQPVPDYCGFRTASWMFARYDDDNGTQEEELYNLVHDPNELRNSSRSRRPRPPRCGGRGT